MAGVKDHRGAGASPADTHDIQVRDPGAGRNNVTGAGSERSVRRTGMIVPYLCRSGDCAQKMGLPSPVKNYILYIEKLYIDRPYYRYRFLFFSI